MVLPVCPPHGCRFVMTFGACQRNLQPLSSTKTGGDDNDGVLINCDGSGAEEDDDGGEEEADDQTRDCIDGVWSVSYDELTE